MSLYCRVATNAQVRDSVWYVALSVTMLGQGEGVGGCEHRQTGVRYQRHADADASQEERRRLVAPCAPGHALRACTRLALLIALCVPGRSSRS